MKRILTKNRNGWIYGIILLAVSIIGFILSISLIYDGGMSLLYMLDGKTYDNSITFYFRSFIKAAILVLILYVIKRLKN